MPELQTYEHSAFPADLSWQTASLIMMLFLSEKGQAGRATFETQPVYAYLINTSDTNSGTPTWQNPPLVRTWCHEVG